jgi:hypothetical protein
MSKTILCLLGAPLWLGAAACSSSDAAPAAAPLDPTFTRVVKEVISEKYCGGSRCHDGSQAGFTLDSASTLHGELVDQPASGPKCRAASPEAGPGFIRVVPGKPDESLLYLKINRAAPCGDAMPGTGTQLTADQIALVHDWILAGAKND